MFILTIISRISFQISANGFRNLSEKQRLIMFFEFKGRKVLLRGQICGSSRPPGETEQYFLNSHARREHFEYLCV